MVCRWRVGKCGSAGDFGDLPHPPNGVIRCGIDFRTREGAAVNAWKVCCGKCQHSWTLMGNWSVYERETLESRPCPKCHSYTLSSPEPTRQTGKKAMYNRRVRWQPAKQLKRS